MTMNAGSERCVETGIPAELSVVVPTYNEAENVGEIVQRLRDCLVGIAWEVIFVDDDSPDGTFEAVRSLASTDYRVRLLHRIGRRGLSTACIEGMQASTAPYVAVMDADLQHDERLLPEMLRKLRDDDLDMVVGSRNVSGGSMGDWSTDRELASNFATWLSGLVLRADLKDPMSGFFMVRRDAIDNVVRELSGIGFKILLDIFVTAKRPLRFQELPYTFRNRSAGESKLDNVVAWQYIAMLLDKSVGRYVPVRFIAFAFIGGLGVFVHMAVLWSGVPRPGRDLRRRSDRRDAGGDDLQLSSSTTGSRTAIGACAAGGCCGAGSRSRWPVPWVRWPTSASRPTCSTPRLPVASGGCCRPPPAS